MKKYNVLGFISDAKHGDDSPPKEVKKEIAALKETNPDFQKIVDYAIGMGKSETETKFTKQLDQLALEKKSLLHKMKEVESTFQGTEQEKAKLQDRISELEEQTMTQDERAQKKYSAEMDKRDTEIKGLKSTALAWQKDFEKLTIKNTILHKVTSGDFEAVNPHQVVDLLSHTAELRQVLDKNGKETDKFKVVLAGISKNGEEPKDFDFDDGFKIWAEKPDNDNLFKSRIAGGGSDKGAGGGGEHAPPNVDLTDIDAYRENRDKILQSVKQKE